VLPSLLDSVDVPVIQCPSSISMSDSGCFPLLFLRYTMLHSLVYSEPGGYCQVDGKICSRAELIVGNWWYTQSHLKLNDNREVSKCTNEIVLQLNNILCSWPVLYSDYSHRCTKNDLWITSPICLADCELLPPFAMMLLVSNHLAKEVRPLSLPVL
jgi:hypothetical protein